MKRELIVLPDENKYPVLAFIVCHTGTCGTVSKEVQLLQAGSGNDDLFWEMAKENAESYGIYPAEEYPEEAEDDESGENYSDNIGGNGYLFHPELLSSVFETAHQILRWLQEAGAIVWHEGFSNTIIIDRDIISRTMDYDFLAFCNMISENSAGEFHISEVGGQCAVIGKAEISDRPKADRLFGGYSIKDIQKNIDDNYVVEKSNLIISDLLAYIRELEK